MSIETALMPKKDKTRRLWLNVKASGITVGKAEFVRALQESIRRGDYRLPKGWKVILEWRNKKAGKMKSGPWEEEMRRSAKSSGGWDRAVSDWLARKE